MLADQEFREMREAFEKVENKFGRKGLLPPNIIDIMKKIITSLLWLLCVATLYKDRIWSTNGSPQSHCEK